MPKQIKAQKSRVLDRELSNFAQSRKNSGPGSTAPPPKPPEAVYDLTGGTGSYCYMAPEITLCKPYNEKVHDLAVRLMCMCNMLLNHFKRKWFDPVSGQAQAYESAHMQAAAVQEV